MSAEGQKPILVLNGPNLNLLGEREPHIYGRETLADVEALCRRTAEGFDLTIDFRQTNAEAQMLDWIHAARKTVAGIVINPGAWTHTSIALLDALSACEMPIVEVHLSNIHRREPFRALSYVSKIASGVICGCGTQGYAFAVMRIAALL
jgi:3-dehydroquinate dehydratase-2